MVTMSWYRFTDEVIDGSAGSMARILQYGVSIVNHKFVKVVKVVDV